MKKSELNFAYPEELVATQPLRPSRVLWVEGQEAPQEISIERLIEQIPSGDLFILNNTKVLKRRVFTSSGLEILFLSSTPDQMEWEVLFPSKKYSVGDVIDLPMGQSVELLEKGRPQRVRAQQALTENFFELVAELPLPPYIQKARGQRHTVQADESWYQTVWAKEAGSLAAPTASLHFSEEHLQRLKARGVQVLEITLHVGLGTFLPVTAEDLNEHTMHQEFYQIPLSVWEQIKSARRRGHHLWSLGTTVCRALESAGRSGDLAGGTRLLLQPGSEFLFVDRLLTNFHQPESTLLALVFAFAGQDQVRAAYQIAIEKKFRLFSYGDLSVWLPHKK